MTDETDIENIELVIRLPGLVTIRAPIWGRCNVVV